MLVSQTQALRKTHKAERHKELPWKEGDAKVLASKSSAGGKSHSLAK